MINNTTETEILECMHGVFGKMQICEASMVTYDDIDDFVTNVAWT